MALFGEKYGDRVRLVEIGDGDYSRELCGGTHVSSTAEIGLFKITSEGSSASNVRRIEAVTGPEAVNLLRRRERVLSNVARTLRSSPEDVEAAVEKRETQLKALEKAAAKAPTADVAAIASDAEDINGISCLFSEVDGVPVKALPDVADKALGALTDPAVVVLASRGDEKVDLVVAASPGAIAKGVKAGVIVGAAAAAVGGGGGGKDSMARAGGKQPELTPDALSAARNAVASA